MSLCDTHKAMKMGLTAVALLKTNHLTTIFLGQGASFSGGLFYFERLESVAKEIEEVSQYFTAGPTILSGRLTWTVPRAKERPPAKYPLTFVWFWDWRITENSDTNSES